MKRRTFLGIGTSLIGVGGLYGTGAFRSVSAGRGVSVAAATDPGGLLGIDGTGSENSLALTNNTSSTLLSVELDAAESNIVYEIDGTELADPTTIDLGFGETKEIGFASSDGRSEVTIDFTATSGTGTTTIRLQRTVQIPQSEQIILTPNVTNVGNSGKFRFEVENEGDIDVDIAAVAINDGSVVGNPDPAEISEELIDRENGNNAPGPIPVLGREPTDTDFVQFSGLIPLTIGNSTEFETDKLVDQDGKNTKYQSGGTLDVSLRLSDGSVALLEMSP